MILNSSLSSQTKYDQNIKYKEYNGEKDLLLDGFGWSVGQAKK